MFFLLFYIEKLNPPISIFFRRIYFALCVRGKNIPQHPHLPRKRERNRQSREPGVVLRRRAGDAGWVLPAVPGF
jgi:hypothetical protein